MTIWTTINKPSVTSWITITKPTLTSNGSRIISTAGSPMGLLMALTYSTTSSIAGLAMWTDVPKPSGTSWTTIPKAT